ncbi:MAG: alpha-galactosidase [Treponema sp.]|jgi:alpha-galactosidase|nr:alpha-galactosidase [Treponema sp.]
MDTQKRTALSEVICGDMAFQYILDNKTRNVGLIAVPSGMLSQIDTRKEYAVLSLIQVKLLGDEGFRGLFARGRTMVNSLSSWGFTFHDQTVSERDGRRTVVTYLQNEKNCVLEHHLAWHEGDRAVTLHSVFRNDSGEDAALEMLSSFSLGAITPFEVGDTPDTLIMHRLRSRWADEGRLETIPVEDLQLEPSFSGVSANTIRFGQTGTMPVREYFPFIAVEDTKRRVSWGAQLAWPGSWQMEACRQDDALHVSGGLADRLSGHWIKKIRPGERFAAPEAIVSVTKGGVDAVSQRLTSLHYRAWEHQSQTEERLPAVFNEWCMTWGGVSADSVERAVKRVKDSGIRYFVMDAGWYDKMGDWNPNAEHFPGGIEKTAQKIRDMGMIPGIWFEYECCEETSKAFSRSEHLLCLDGHVITESGRRFWDLRDPYVRTYLAEKVTGFLKKYGFGYLKIDYNANIGIGCDGGESPGEGLRQHVAGVLEFLREIRRELPDLVIENCSSGGHRLEPCMMGLTAMASFSDAHENAHIPVIAANLHRAVLPCQAQIWAVVRKSDSTRRLYYTMTAGVLGRLCLSGNIDELDAAQWDIVKEGIDFYYKITAAIKKGFTYWFGPEIKSYRHPKGWQAILRLSDETTDAYAVVHTFAGEFKEPIVIQLPEGYMFEPAESYMENREAAVLERNTLKISPAGEFQGFALRMKYMPEGKQENNHGG